MSVPPDMMAKMMAGGAGGPPGAPPGAKPPGASPPAPGGAPAGGPMSTPQPKAGQTQAAMVNVEMSIQLLEQSMGMFPLESPEKTALVDAHKVLVKAFGASRAKTAELIPAELTQLMQTIPGAGGGSPAAKAMGALPGGAPAMPAPQGA